MGEVMRGLKVLLGAALALCGTAALVSMLVYHLLNPSLTQMQIFRQFWAVEIAAVAALSFGIYVFKEAK